MNLKILTLCGFLIFFSNSVLFGQPNFSKRSIFQPLNIAKKVSIGDIDGDGDMDMAAVASNQDSAYINIIWFEDIDGTQNYQEHEISSYYWDARAVCVGDLVEGGYLEIVTGARSRHRLTLWEYDSNSSTWIADSSFTTVSPNNYSICITDLNDDGDLDIVTTFGPTTNGVYWYQGDGAGNFIQRTITTDFENAVDLDVGLIDNDEYKDIVTVGFIAAGENVKFLQNDGTPEDGGWRTIVIERDYDRPNTVDLSDIDNDGDLDILSAEFFAANISWWENDGTGRFGDEQPTSWVDQIRNVRGGDIDGDGDTDALAAADENDRISWFENDGNLSFTERIITNDFSYAYFTVPSDLDGDGDVDVIGSAQGVTPNFSGEIAWWENDQDDDQLIAAGNPDPAPFWNGKVVIDFSAGTEDSVTVFYNAGKNSDLDAVGLGIDHIAVKGYYTITTRKTGYTASIDFYYGSGNVPEWSAITPGSETDLVLCLWDDTNSEWIFAGSSQTVDAANDKITVNGISSEMLPFSKWTLGSTTTDNPLPVQLASFSSQIVPEGVKLNWVTASEINNLGFEIWRADAVDSNYILIADYRWIEDLQGAGNQNQQSYYSYIDKQVQSGKSYYYLLGDVDFNNNKTWHGPLEVVYEVPSLVNTFQLGQNYPNPFNGYTRIPIHLNSSESFGGDDISLKIFNILGEEIKNLKIGLLNPGENEFLWDGADNMGKSVASGQYIYRFDFGEMSQSRRLILIR